MKNIFKKHFKLAIVCAVAAMITLSVFAATVTKSVSGSAVQHLAGGATVSDIVVTTPANNAATIVFFDAPTTATTYTNQEYTTRSVSSGLVTNTYVNYIGATNTVIYTALTQTTVTNAASTNLWPIMLSVTVPTNTTTTLSGDWKFVSGITSTNSGAATVSITYTK